MLILLLRVGPRRYALDAREVVEVVPCVPLRPAPGAAAWIAGLLPHREGIAPVIDLSRLLTGTPAAALLSTRLIVLRRAGGGLIALLAEGATHMMRLDAAPAADARIELADGEPAQLIGWADLIPPALRASLPESPTA